MLEDLILRRKRKRIFDICLVIFLAIITICYFTYNHITSESRGVNLYSSALVQYKDSDYEKAYQSFAKVPYSSCLKDSARFRQARCATNIGKKELAIKKYQRIVKSSSKSSIVPISEYNMANLYFELGDDSAKKHFKNITYDTDIKNDISNFITLFSLKADCGKM